MDREAVTERIEIGVPAPATAITLPEAFLAKYAHLTEALQKSEWAATVLVQTSDDRRATFAFNLVRAVSEYNRLVAEGCGDRGALSAAAEIIMSLISRLPKIEDGQYQNPDDVKSCFQTPPLCSMSKVLYMKLAPALERAGTRFKIVRPEYPCPVCCPDPNCRECID